MNFKVENRFIGPDHAPFIIAEMSGNHNQSLERALEIVREAAKAGAHALKLQTYTPDTMTLNIKEGEFFISDSNSLWKGESLYNLYKEAFTPWEWHAEIFSECKKLGMIGFSTPFDESAVEFLEKLNVPLYKIASFENNDIPLIKKIAQTGKPVIISTGMSSISELDEAISTLKNNGCKDIVMLKCTSTYPSTPKDSNVLTIPHMKALFNVQVGLSDHTMGCGVAVAATALGATVIEKHFTLNRKDGGVDSAFSMEPNELAALVTETQRAWEAIGKIHYGPTAAEKQSLKFRRSIYISQDVKAGEKLTLENVKVIRPGLGMPPKYFETVLGRTLRADAKRGTPLSWDLLG